MRRGGFSLCGNAREACSELLPGVMTKRAICNDICTCGLILNGVALWLLKFQKLRRCWRSDDKFSFKNTNRQLKQLYHIPEQDTDSGAAGEGSEPLIPAAPRHGRKRQAGGAEAGVVVEDVIEEVCPSDE
jgi:hypothetical protein